MNDINPPLDEELHPNLTHRQQPSLRFGPHARAVFSPFRSLLLSPSLVAPRLEWITSKGRTPILERVDWAGGRAPRRISRNLSRILWTSLQLQQRMGVGRLGQSPAQPPR